MMHTSREKTSNLFTLFRTGGPPRLLAIILRMLKILRKSPGKILRNMFRKYIKGKPHATGILTTPENKPALEASLKTKKN